MNDMPYHLLFQDRVERGTSTNSPLSPPLPLNRDRVRPYTGLDVLARDK